jgi:hypothetical protein
MSPDSVRKLLLAALVAATGVGSVPRLAHADASCTILLAQKIGYATQTCSAYDLEITLT